MMTLDEIHEKHTAEEDPLEKMRREEAETERKFPGYPPYVSEVVLQKIEWNVEDSARRLRRMLAEMFGSFAVEKLDIEDLEYWMRSLAQSVAHQAAGSVAAQSALQAQQASYNMLMGTLAGIALGANDNTRPEEERTTDAS
jgi:hypothetical protein